MIARKLPWYFPGRARSAQYTNNRYIKRTLGNVAVCPRAIIIFQRILVMALNALTVTVFACGALDVYTYINNIGKYDIVD